MAEKIPVIVMVDPEHEVTIKPFAATLAKAVTGQATTAGITTGTATVTYNNGAVDGDATID